LTDIPKARAEIQAHFRGKFAEKGIPFPGDPLPVLAETPAEKAAPPA
jgi:hypothetical protein